MNFNRLLLFVCTFLHYQLSTAEELNPHSYVNIPIGQNFIGLAYGYSDGNINTSPDLPIENVTLRIDGTTFFYARSLSLFGQSTKFDISVGQACGVGKAIFEENNVSRSFCGITDTKVQLNCTPIS